MTRFIFLTFGFLTIGFYELSGGADFDPVKARETLLEARSEMGNSSPAQGDVALAASREISESVNETPARAALNLVSFSDAGAESPQAAAEDAVASLPAEEPTSPALTRTSEAPRIEMIGITSLGSDFTDISFEGLSRVAASERVEMPKDIRSVTGSLVNMRSGPGTSYDVVSQLAQDTKVEILSDAGTGWVELRPVDGGPSGWMAEFLLTK